MLRDGPWKYIFTHGLPPMLFNLDTDPDERHDLAGQADFAHIEKQLHARLIETGILRKCMNVFWQVQRERLFLAEVANTSSQTPNWAFQPFVDESKRFIRGAGSAGPTSVKSRARFPYVEPVQPDKPTGTPPESSETDSIQFSAVSAMS